MIRNLIRRRERRGLRLWNVGVVLALTFVTAIAIAAGVFFAGWDLLGARGLKTQRRLDASTLFDLVKLAFGVVAGAGALVALVVAYRRQRVDEEGALREATRLHTERFTTAVSQLGDDQTPVRLGGVHALAGLADDAPTDLLRQTCIDVLCAYLRLPYIAESDLPPDDAAARRIYLAMREVRHTIIRVIRDRMSVGPEETHLSWQGHDFDFTGVVFDGGDLSGAVFSTGGTVSFRDAVFSGGAVSFDRTWFSGGTVSFDGARFVGGTVDFTLAEFSGGRVSFLGARFSGGTVSFRRARFSGGTVGFSESEFAGGEVDFVAAVFSGGAVSFRRALFSDGAVSFRRVVISGGEVDFVGAVFSGSMVDFTHAELSGGDVGFPDGVVGPAPIGLVPSTGQPLPPGLRLPERWLTPEP
ncbi:hypothetical protein GCM10009837_66970 [Streptomyces durmitorensis]|uniref:Pentapeptide repeat-containing protein n=1 Tax=Streptomyces durmitorensis TaxID=319947 RepID=A0ABY4Q7G4_9ACTN|nr:pentapeptide repeat-containing protein [Streptomyces durmitorensis]UQT61188.1 pentapeptide repeat-containing protein [Streptomyces durmitorensis]